MSGHSKWHKLKNRKGKTDAARANVFTKLCRAITVAAMQGGGDQTMNFSLRLAVEKARAANVPKDNIDRAIKRGTGELADGVQLEPLKYEGFGPNGTAFLVETVTDNRNRTASDMKHIFTKYGGSLGSPGSAEWQFVHQGVIQVGDEFLSVYEQNTEEKELMLIDAGAEDISKNDHGLHVVTTVAGFPRVVQLFESWHMPPKESALEWVAKESISVGKEEEEKVLALYDAFDEHDDVRAVYTNLHVT